MGFKENLVRGVFALKKDVIEDAPTIGMVASTVCIVAGAAVNLYMADEIAEVTRKVKARVQEMHDVDDDSDGWEGMGESKAHFILGTIKEAAVGYGKTAGPGLGLQGLGLGLAWGVKGTLENRNTVLAALVASKAAEFSQYRERVRADVGEEKDQEYLTGCVTRKVVETNEDGTVISEKVIAMPVLNEDSAIIPHSFVFDESNTELTKSVDANYNFICGAIRSANLILHKQGYIFENEIRDCFGADRTVTGQYSGAIAEYVNEAGDKVERNLRINPIHASRLINGEDPSAIIQVEYDDGEPLEDDILSHRKELNLALR